MSNKYTYEQNQKIVTCIRTAVAKTKHHQQLTRRVSDAIRAELDKTFGLGITFYMRMPGVLSGSVEIYGCGCDYNNRFYSFMDHAKPGVHWSDAILNGLRREDMSDYQEREQLEVSELYRAFAIAESEIVKLQERIDHFRKMALDRIAELPVPAAAIEASFRSEKHFWDRPSSAAKSKFPNLFPK